MGIWDDDFTGSDGDPPDSSKWEVIQDDESAFDISSNTYRLDVSLNGTDEILRWMTAGRCAFDGDFDIQIDFPSKYCSYTNGSWQIYSFGIATAELDIWETIGLRHYSGYSYQPSVFGSYASGSPEKLIDTGATLGFTKIRFTRSGSVVKGFLWDSGESQWEWDGGTDGYTFTGIEDDYTIRPFIYLAGRRVSGGVTVHCAFDNFLVNSGTAYALPYYGSVDAGVGFNAVVDGFNENGNVEAEMGFNATVDAQTDWADIQEDLGLNATVEPNGSIYNVNNALNYVGFKATVDAFVVNVFADAGLGLNGAVDADYQTKWMAAGIGFKSGADAHREYPREVSAEVGLNAVADAYNYSLWIKENLSRATKRFALTITGTPDGVADTEVKIITLSGRKRTDAKTYIGAVVPYEYVGDITARPNGEMVVEAVYMVGGVESLREEILRATIDNVDDNKGARNRSITLTGYKTASFGPKDVTLTKPNYRRVSQGLLQYRFVDVDLFLNPGDSLTVGTDTFTVGNITYYINPNRAQMDVFEAEV